MSSEGGAGTAVLGGQSGGQMSGQGDGAQGAGAQGAQGSQGGQGQQQTWFSGFDAETRGWLDNRGYTREADLTKILPEMVKAHRNAESAIGRDKVVWPKDSADKEGWAEIHKRMGVPSKWEDYGLVPLNADGTPNEKADRTYANSMAQAFHKLGIPKEAAAAIAGEHTRLNAALMAAEADAFKAQSEQEMEALTKEWGPNADANFASAQRATRAFGLDPGALGKIERAIGTKSMMGLLNQIGLAISEDFRGAGGGAGGNGMMSPQAAQARLTELRGDKEWTKRYFDGDRTAVAEYDRLIRMVASAA